MNNMELYKVFRAVAHTASFSGAAKRLYITQPAVSQSIKQLETELGTPLFIRNARGVSLTAEGKTLYDFIDSAFDLVEQGETRLDQMKKLQQGEIKIGAGDTICEHFLLRYLERFHNLYPNIRLQVVNRTSVEAAALLKKGALDIAFVNLPMHDELLEVAECMQIEDVFIAGGKFSFLKGQVLSWGQLVQYPLIMLEQAANSRRFVDQEFLSAGIRLEPEIELGAHHLLIAFAKIGLGISCVIREFSQQALESGDVFALRLDRPLPKRSIGLCTLSSIPPSNAAKTFIDWCYRSLIQS